MHINGRTSTGCTCSSRIFSSHSQIIKQAINSRRISCVFNWNATNQSRMRNSIIVHLLLIPPPIFIIIIILNTIKLPFLALIFCYIWAIFRFISLFFFKLNCPCPCPCCYNFIYSSVLLPLFLSFLMLYRFKWITVDPVKDFVDIFIKRNDEMFFKLSAHKHRERLSNSNSSSSI